MKKFLLAFTALTFSIAVCSQTIIPAGEVSGTWTLYGSPYLIMGTINVPGNSTLIIEPGVEVEFQGSYTLWVNGRILAQGTESDTILFTAADPDVGFRSIRFSYTNPDNDTSRFEYCLFEYGNVYGAWPDNCGGAVAAVDFSKLVVDHCLFRFNYAIEPNVYPTNASGGAIALSGSSPLIRNCTFVSNEATNGGAIVSAIGSYPVIENNLFQGNRAIGIEMGEGYGGAILNWSNSDGVVCHNTFRDNLAENGGGGVAVIDNCSPIIHHNLFCNDTAGWGGAIEVQDICQPTITNNTIANNHASLWGGGVHLWTECHVEIRNSILWENTPSQIHLQEYTDTISVYYSDVMGGQAAIAGNGFLDRYDNCIDEDPLFEGSDTAYYHLTVLSPCIDAGGPFCNDPDGTPCDMGACWCNYLGVGNAEFKIQNSKFKIDLFPNPADRIVNCQLSIVDFQSVTMKIYDMYGKSVRTLADGTYQKGEYHLQVNIADLPAGIYLVRLQAGNETTVVKLCKQ